MKIGILKERKSKIDNRCAFSPLQVKEIMNQNPQVQIVVESSDIRCFTNDEFSKLGIEVVDNIEDCDLLIGIKEVPIEYLIKNKKYLFFSHTAKKQVFNRQLLLNMISHNITMIDYEYLKNAQNVRLIGFGKWAGIVGSHNGLLNYGKKTGLFNFPPAYDFFDYNQIKDYYKSIELPPIKIAITGTGNVAKGAVEVLTNMGIPRVSPQEFLQIENKLVYTQLSSADIYEDENGAFDKANFYSNPELYKSTFRKYAMHTDVLINGLLWNDNIDRLFKVEDMQNPHWKIKVIADVTCDVNGGIPITTHSTSIKCPSYGVLKSTKTICEAYLPTDDSVDVMAVDNLPNELPRDASEEFGKRFSQSVLSELLSNHSTIIDNATICKQGELNTPFRYLESFIE